MAQPIHDSSPSGQVPCTYHPDVMTGLRCSRCGKPICPKCAVRTPVGLRCPDCAGVRGLPTIRTSGSTLVRAGAAGLAVAAVVSLLWYFGPDWKFYLSIALGFGVAESMAYVARGKRGTDLQLVGIAIVTLAIIASRVLLAWKYGFTLELITAGDGLVYEPVRYWLQLRIIPDVLFMALSYVIVWIRFR